VCPCVCARVYVCVIMFPDMCGVGAGNHLILIEFVN
jgi:hypothetical protein